jgi:enoyl-ACP reductase-like protein
VAALFDRVAAEQGGLDLLVANAFGGDADAFTTGPFWTLPLEHWRNMFDSGVRGHLVAARFAAPLLIARGGLVVLTGYAHRDPDTIALHVDYDLAMQATSRLAFGLAQDLRGPPRRPHHLGRRSGQRIRVQRSRGSSPERGPVAAGGMGRRRETHTKRTICTHRKDTLP